MKLNTILPVALLMLAATACQNDNEPNFAYQSDPDAVRINPTIALQSRVNTQAEGNAWTAGDQIKVNITSADAVEGKDAAIYKYTSSWNIQGSDYMVWPSRTSSKSYTFQAYYPYAAESTTSFSNFVLPSNQSSATAGEGFIGNADWMVAEMNTVKTEVVNLAFAHQLTKVSVTIKEYKDQYSTNLPEISGPKFTLPSIPTSLKGKNVTVQNSAKEINALMLPDNSAKKFHTFTAVVMPGKYTEGDTFLTLTVNGSPLKVKADGNIELTQTGLKAGKAYTFNLTFGKRGFSIGNVTVNDWGESDWEEGEHGGIADEVSTL